MIVATTDVHGRVRGWDYVGDAEAPGGLALSVLRAPVVAPAEPRMHRGRRGG